ncbi:MAG: permease-like cell division protein FtsX [Saprospiraceae bacterium]|jgi:cell division transport system permease protein
MARSKPNYLYAIISVALVLFMLGFFAVTAIHARQLVKLFKEKVDIWLELQPGTSQDDITRLVADIRSQEFVKEETVRFITREQAIATMREDLGDESMLEEIPNMMRDVISFNVQADYLKSDSLSNWKEQLKTDPAVLELYLEAADIGNIGGNIQTIGYITLFIGLLLIFAAVTLIHNTIRLALYSNRFIIKSQELVGASWEFISKPYLRRGILNGLWSAAIAIALLIGLLWMSQRLVPELSELEDLNGILATFTGMVLLGVLISGLSTYFVVNKFLNMRLDDLY